MSDEQDKPLAHFHRNNEVDTIAGKLHNDGSVELWDHTKIAKDGTVAFANGDRIAHDGSVRFADGTTFGADGTITTPDGWSAHTDFYGTADTPEAQKAQAVSGQAQGVADAVSGKV